jgi:hypothetical protein
MAHKYNLGDFKEKKNREGAIEIETERGTFVIDAPELWSDEVATAAMQGDATLLGPALLGAAYDEFVAAGGNAVILMSIVEEVHGENAGKSSSSSASSAVSTPAPSKPTSSATTRARTSTKRARRT